MKPENIELKLLAENDFNSFKDLILLFQDVFDEKSNSLPSDLYLKELLSRNDFVVYIAVIKDEVIGGLTAYELKNYYKETSEYFIYDIAVKQTLQRKGIGKALLAALRQDAMHKGIDETFVAAHQDDKQAVDFYISTGGQQESVLHFNYRNTKI